MTNPKLAEGISNAKIISLIIETSTERAIVGIIADDAVLYEELLSFGYMSSQELIPHIAKAFKDLSLSPKQLSYISVGVGPGSYTGMRIGAVVAKCLAYACQTPLLGVGSLMSFIPDREGLFLAAIDAKIGGVYLIKGRQENGRVTYLSPPELCPLNAMQEKLQGISHIVTPNSLQLRPKLEALFPHMPVMWMEKNPDLMHLHRQSQAAYQLKNYALYAQLELLYMRKTQAEIEKEQRPK